MAGPWIAQDCVTDEESDTENQAVLAILPAIC
jgi:hypothetical protein